MPSDNVLEFSLGIGSAPTELRSCGHPHVLVDLANSTVFCRDCEQRLSAFSILCDYAVQERSLRRQDRDAKRLVAALRWILKQKGRLTIGSAGVRAVRPKEGGGQRSSSRTWRGPDLLLDACVDAIVGVSLLPERVGPGNDWMNPYSREVEEG